MAEKKTWPSASQTVSFGSPSDGLIGLVIEEIDSDADSPFKQIVVYCRDKVTVSMTAGTAAKKGKHSGNKDDILGINSSSAKISNPNAANVQITAQGSLFDKKGSVTTATLIYDPASNQVKSSDGSEIHGAFRATYSYTGDIYECDISNAPFFDKSRKAVFMAQSKETDLITKIETVHFADNTLSYTPKHGTKTVLVEELSEKVLATDAIKKDYIKYCAVYAQGTPTVKITSGKITSVADYSEAKIQLVAFLGLEANLSHPGIEGDVSLTKIGTFCDKTGQTVDPGFTYDKDSGLIKTSSKVKVFGALKAEFKVKGKKHTCDIKDAPIVDKPKRQAILFAFLGDESGSATLEWEDKSDSFGGAAAYSSKNDDATKNKDASALSMKLSEWQRFDPIIDSKNKELSIFFEIVTVPSSLEMILEDIKSVHVCTLQSSYDPNQPYKSKKNDETVAAYTTGGAGTDGGGGGGGGTAVKNPEGLLIGKANDLSTIPYYAIPVRKYLNYMNQSSMSLDNLPYQIDLIKAGAAWDFFGNSLSVSVRKPGEWVFSTTWGYNTERREMFLENLGEKVQVGPTEIAIVDQFDRLVPVVLQVYIEYKITKAFFMATMAQLENAKGHDPKKWVPKDAFIFASGVYKLGIYKEDFEDIRRISGSWLCTSIRMKEQYVALTNTTTKPAAAP